MKNLLRQLFSPLLSVLEKGDGMYHYKESHRTILLAVGVLFFILSAVSATAAITASEWGGILPFTIFLVIGIVCEAVGFLGNDRAVAKMWGNK